MDPSPDERELWPVRVAVVVASAAAGLLPPTGPVSIDFRDLDALARSTDLLRRGGFGARACIHPAQVATVNAVFTPSPEQVDRAAALIAGHETFLAGGRAVSQGADGRLVDEALVRAARRTLDRAGVVPAASIDGTPFH